MNKCCPVACLFVCWSIDFKMNKRKKSLSFRIHKDFMGTREEETLGALQWAKAVGGRSQTHMCRALWASGSDVSLGRHWVHARARLPFTFSYSSVYCLSYKGSFTFYLLAFPFFLHICVDETVPGCIILVFSVITCMRFSWFQYSLS